MKKIIPNITVDSCSEALEFYKQVFGGKVENIQTSEGKEMFKGYEGKIIHSEFIINDECIMYFTDIFGPKASGSNISLMLQMDSEDEISRIYLKLKEKGRVTFELQKTFWGSYHAVVTDTFGVTWSLDYSGK